MRVSELANDLGIHHPYYPDVNPLNPYFLNRDFTVLNTVHVYILYDQFYLRHPKANFLV